MDLLPTSEQYDLAKAARALCEARADHDRPVSEWWPELTELGLFELRVPDSRGGLGLGMSEAVLCFSELGRALVPGPLVATHLYTTLLDGGSPRMIGVLERDQTPWLVEDLDQLDALVVLDGNTLSVLEPATVRAEVVREPLDPSARLFHVLALPAVASAAEGTRVTAWQAQGTTLTAALQLGIAEAVLERSVRYAQERHQFGRAIGSFQAVKHILADMLVRTEIARAALHVAAATVDDPESGDIQKAAATAKILADDAATRNAADAVQVHGGMGFSWEVDVHRYLKRAWVQATRYGHADEHADALAVSLAAEPHR